MCSEQSIHGPCEHTYIVLVDTGDISTQACMAIAAHARPRGKAGGKVGEDPAGSNQPPPASVPGPRSEQSCIQQASTSTASAAQKRPADQTKISLQKLLQKVGPDDRGLLNKLLEEDLQVRRIAKASDLGLSHWVACMILLW